MATLVICSNCSSILGCRIPTVNRLIKRNCEDCSLYLEDMRLSQCLLNQKKKQTIEVVTRCKHCVKTLLENEEDEIYIPPS